MDKYHELLISFSNYLQNLIVWIFYFFNRQTLSAVSKVSNLYTQFQYLQVKNTKWDKRIAQVIIVNIYNIYSMSSQHSICIQLYSCLDLLFPYFSSCINLINKIYPLCLIINAIYCFSHLFISYHGIGDYKILLALIFSTLSRTCPLNCCLKFVRCSAHCPDHHLQYSDS